MRSTTRSQHFSLLNQRGLLDDLRSAAAAAFRSVIVRIDVAVPIRTEGVEQSKSETPSGIETESSPSEVTDPRSWRRRRFCAPQQAIPLNDVMVFRNRCIARQKTIDVRVAPEATGSHQNVICCNGYLRNDRKCEIGRVRIIRRPGWRSRSEPVGH